MQVVYVAGPFRAQTAWAIELNVREAESWGFKVAMAGGSPLIPHANTRYFHGSLPDSFWLDATMALLRKSDVVFLIPGWQASVGATAEKEEAHRLNLPVFDEIGALASWLDAKATIVERLRLRR